MLESLLSKGALRYRKFISGKQLLLSKKNDLGVILANSKEEANEKMKLLIKNKSQFKSRFEVSNLLGKDSTKAFYIIGIYGLPRTWEIGDCFYSKV